MTGSAHEAFRPLRVLLSAYACEPDRGSEPGVGWNWVTQIAKSHEVWVITRANNRQQIAEALRGSLMTCVHWEFVDLPRWLRFWKRQRRGIHIYYYIWQIAAYWRAKRLHRSCCFDLVHHVTLVTYWMPSFMALLPIPFVWGPVGGGDSIPPGLRRALHWRGKLYELCRTAIQWLSSFDPFLRLTARRAAVAMGTTNQTCGRLRALGCRRVQLCSQVALSVTELTRLAPTNSSHSQRFRVVSVGALLHLKGFELSIRAFADFYKERPAAEYWIIGDGPERMRLQALAATLGVDGNIKFWGMLPRAEVLDKLHQCNVMLHPALHDSGGWASLEGMASGLPVIGLDTAGTAVQLTSSSGIKVATVSPEQCVRDMTLGLIQLAQDNNVRHQMSVGAHKRVREHFCWDAKGQYISDIYQRVVARTV